MTFRVLAILTLVLPLICRCHEDHGHSHGEDPKYRWSREANTRQEDEIMEEEIMEEDIVEIPAGFSEERPIHGHSHGGHGHSHGGHGHSHGGHGHSHGGHGHSHGGHGHSHTPQREPTPEERKKNRERLHKIWDDDEDEDERANAKQMVWLYALSSTLAISLAPFIILFFLNVDNSKDHEGTLKVLLGFASGGLLGDAFLHLIPHAIMAQEGEGHDHHGHSHSHGHSHGEGEGHSHDLTVGLGVLAGILAFMLVEKLVRIYSGGHGHSHEVVEAKESDKKKEKKKAKNSDDEGEKVKGATGDGEEENKKKKKKQSEAEKEIQKKVDEAPQSGEIRVAGYLNLFADIFHNFTDGLAIGASFLAGNSVGAVTTITILFHEIPHEIGDYAILIQSGVRPFQAKCLQLLTAVGAFLGCLVSVAFGEIGDAVTAFILPFTAGGFIYIATVSVIPELLEGSTMKQSIKEVVALLVGVAMMIVIAQYE